MPESPPPTRSGATPVASTDAPSGAPATRGGRAVWPGIAALLAILAIALFFGSRTAAPSSGSARTVSIESQVRCPSCLDLSVADSSAPSAIAVRHQISRDVAAGEPTQQIENTLVSQYGVGILLRPPTSGIAGLVWLIPLSLGVVALGALGWLFWRRSRSFSALRDGSGGSDPSDGAGPDPSNGAGSDPSDGQGTIRAGSSSGPVDRL